MSDAQRQLLAAIKQQSLEGVKAALALGADTNAYDQERSMLGWHEDAVALLLEYEQPSWLAILEALLVAGANPNLPIEQRFLEYLLHALSQHSHLAAMRLILDYDADPNLVSEGDTALSRLNLDYSFEETCNLPDWYKGRVLPEYEAPQDDLEDRETASIWLVSRHQRGWAMLRQAGGLNSWELRQGPVSETLGLYPDVLGGLYTRHARPEAGFLASLGSALTERIARWSGEYKNPDLLGYEAQAVKNFDYAAHLTEGMAIGQAIAPFLPEATALKIAMPTAASIAAKSTMLDVHAWNSQSQAWEKTVDWRDKLSPDWFGPEPAGKLRLKYSQ
ncbi:hypothetical protein [Propionivibrio sp.]|uniref:hypothetical protein n=1 Tax=Propionivibrio sp. TaxID=2212460 RepID=UPI003BEFCC84